MAKSRKSAPNGDSEPMSFEDSFKRLNEMAKQLETGGLSLAEATTRFEEGMNLVQHCNELLNSAELKITELKEAYRSENAGPRFKGLDGSYEDQDEDPDQDLDG